MMYLPSITEWDFWVEICSKDDDPIFGLDGLMVRWPAPPEIDAFTDWCQHRAIVSQVAKSAKSE